MSPDRDADERERLRRARAVSQRFPAGLEDGGRDEALEHPKDVQPSGARGDHRHSAPGTSIPGAPRPAAEGESSGPSDSER
jgi:hypothetical protein